MDRENIAPEPPQSLEWGIYKDAFAPPRPTRLTKSWERAAVSAHAPRLHGKKIWKKANSSHKSLDNKSSNEAQNELEREGNGARKKMRGIGEKENISSPKWLLTSDIHNENDISGCGFPSPLKKDTTSLDVDALVVPRKRTNANHLITPKRTGQKIPLQDSTCSPARAAALDNIASSKASSGVSNSLESLTAKPRRRASSIRKSFRRFSNNHSVDQECLNSFGAVGLPTNDSLSQETSALDPAQKSPSCQPFDTCRTVSVVAEGSKSRVDPVPVLGESVLCEMEPLLVVETTKNPNKDDPTLEDVYNQQNSNTLSTLQEESIVNSGSSLQVDEAYGSEEAAVNSIATKPSETPKRKKRASSRVSRTPRTSPVKRGTRATRSSSIIQESLSPAKVQEVSPSNEQPVQARSLCKSQYTPQPQISQILPTTPLQPEDELQDEAKINLEASTCAISSVHPQDSKSDMTLPHVGTPLLNQEVSNKSEIGHMEDVLNLGAGASDLELNQDEIDADIERLEMSTKKSSSPCQVSVRYQEPELAQDYQNESSSESAQAHDTNNSLDSNNAPQLSENLDHLGEIALHINSVTEILSDDAVPGLPETSITTELVGRISEDVPPTLYNDDDTDLLRSFLTRVNANKAAKASGSIPKRKRSLPHSPIQLPLGTAPTASSPASPKAQEENDELADDIPGSSPSKRRRIKQPVLYAAEEETRQLRATRRSGRTNTRLPVKAAPLAAPSFIPVRRLGGQDGDNTVTLRRNEEKELASLTKFNTRKNKGGAILPQLVVAKKAEEKDDPVAKHKALKEAFDEMAPGKRGANKKGRNVVWAEELTHFQTITKEFEAEPALILPLVAEEKKLVVKGEDKKAVKVGVRSKIALGMAANGTPAPKRQLKPRRKL